MPKIFLACICKVIDSSISPYISPIQHLIIILKKKIAVHFIVSLLGVKPQFFSHCVGEFTELHSHLITLHVSCSLHHIVHLCHYKIAAFNELPRWPSG